MKNKYFQQYPKGLFLDLFFNIKVRNKIGKATWELFLTVKLTFNIIQNKWRELLSVGNSAIYIHQAELNIAPGNMFLVLHVAYYSIFISFYIYKILNTDILENNLENSK